MAWVQANLNGWLSGLIALDFQALLLYKIIPAKN